MQFLSWVTAMVERTLARHGAGDAVKINADIDVSALKERLGLTERNVAYATVNAINDTAKQVQALARENVRSKFTLRGGQPSDFILRQAAIIKPFASVRQGRPYAEIAVGQGSGGRPLLLSTFEAGGERRPFVGKTVAIPIIGNAARPTFAQPVPAALQVRSLRFRPEVSRGTRAAARRLTGPDKRGTTQVRRQFLAGQARVWQGDERTYLIPGVGIFQRVGPGRTDTRLLYAFRSQERLPQRLGFLALAQQQGGTLLADNMQHELIRELSLRRGS